MKKLFRRFYEWFCDLTPVKCIVGFTVLMGIIFFFMFAGIYCWVTKTDLFPDLDEGYDG